MTEAISEALNRSGYTVTQLSLSHLDSESRVGRRLEEASPSTTVLLRLKEWKSDTYYRTRVVYDVELEVRSISERGERKAHLNFSGSESVGGSFWNPPGHAKRAVPIYFKARVEEWFSDPLVRELLQ